MLLTYKLVGGEASAGTFNVAVGDQPKACKLFVRC